MTPPPVMMFPSRVTRLVSTIAPKGSSSSRQAQWQAARLPARNPPAARISEPVQTDVRYLAPAPSRRISRMKASSSMASVAPNPPGTHSRSQRSTLVRSLRPANTRPSAAMSRPPIEATITSTPGARLST